MALNCYTDVQPGFILFNELQGIIKPQICLKTFYVADTLVYIVSEGNRLVFTKLK